MALFWSSRPINPIVRPIRSALDLDSNVSLVDLDRRSFGDGAEYNELEYNTQLYNGGGSKFGLINAGAPFGFTVAGVGRLLVLGTTGPEQLTFANTGTLTGTGILAGAGAPVFANTGALGGAGILAGSSATVFANTGTVAGSGALAGTAAVAFTGDGTLTGS